MLGKWARNGRRTLPGLLTASGYFSQSTRSDTGFTAGTKEPEFPLGSSAAYALGGPAVKRVDE